MIEATLQTTMLSEWIVAGGQEGFSGADNAPLRDADGLPYLPARSLRGLLLHACKQVESNLGLEICGGLFGGEGRKGQLRLGEALLPADLRREVLEADGEERTSLKEDFYTDVSRTRIDPDSGTAAAHSLRTMQVGIPGLVFLARVEVPDTTGLRLIGYGAGLVRHVGAKRYRGLGRCRMQLYRAGELVQPTLADIRNIATGDQS